jgi:peptidyl-prolyl cis-trans isomerase A (cyclophilin A)
MRKSKPLKRGAWIAFACLLLHGCSNAPKKQPAEQVEEKVKKAERAPDTYHVKFETTKGSFVVECVREWAPRGSDRFYELVEGKFYDNARFFRVRPRFIAQFGIHADPKQSALWRELKFADDPVKQRNRRGTLSFAMHGPGTRTTQVFINLADNSGSLDRQRFAPFARVVEGMDVVDKLYASYGELQSLGGGGPDAKRIEMQGEEYLERTYPRLDKIQSARVVTFTQPVNPSSKSKTGSSAKR